MAGLMAGVRDFEDFGALCGGEDGMDVVRGIVAAAPSLLLHDDHTGPGAAEGPMEPPRASIFLEVDPSHPPLLEGWLSDEQAAPSGTGRVAWLASEEDVFGRLRFCVLGIVDCDRQEAASP